MSIFVPRKGRIMNTRSPVSIEVWDPFESFFSFTPFIACPLAAPSMDWKETTEDHVFVVDLPGLKKEEVKVEVEEEKVLKISGQRSKQNEEKNDKWHRVEWGSEKFMRSVRLPANARVGKAKAVLENGTLIVTVPKEKEEKAIGKFLEIEG